jgi:5'-nucleotidase
VLEHALARGDRAAYIAGAQVRYDPRRRPGQRVQNVELQGGQKLRPSAEYTLAVDDFLAAGGQGYVALTGLPTVPATILDVEALVTYLRRVPQPVSVSAPPGFQASR